MQNTPDHEQTDEQFRELSIEELTDVSGGVHLGGIADKIAQYLWGKALP